jgi:hypothetical protein
MAEFRIRSDILMRFLKRFSGMDDLIIKVDAGPDGYGDENDHHIDAAGTLDRAFYISQWTAAEVVTAGTISVGQVGTLTALLKSMSGSTNEVTIESTEDTITVSDGATHFTLPTATSVASAAGTAQVAGMVHNAGESDWSKFGSGEFDFHLTFPAETFRTLTKVGSPIINGATLGVFVTKDGEFTYAVHRDSTRVETVLESSGYTPKNSPDEPTVVWFGKWLLDALKAMPGSGVIHVHGGNDCPLVIRHSGDNQGVVVVIAPRNEAGDEV